MKRGQAFLSFIIGLSVIFLTAITTDQIWQSVYDSSNTALRVNLVSGGGGGTVTGTGTANQVSYWTSTTALAALGAGTTGQVLTSTGAGVPTYQTPGASTAAPVAILLPNAAVTGTTVNKLAKVQAAGTVVITATSDTVGALGVVTAGAGTTGSATIQLIGSTTCIFDNAVTAGDFIGISSGTAGDCTDLGSTFPSNQAVLGIVTETNGSPGTRAVILQTPDIMNTTNIKGGNPGKGGITDLLYSGKLTVAGVDAENASFTIDNRIELITTGASAIAATTPASPTIGDTYTLVKIDSGAGTVVWTRAGSQTLNGATTRTISAQYGVDTCVYVSSNVWVCQGAGA